MALGQQASARPSLGMFGAAGPADNKGRMTGMLRILGFILSFTVLAVVAAPLSAAETTLRVTLQLPLKSHLGENLLLFKEEAERNSDGEIKVQIFDSARLYKDKEVPKAVGSGQIEMGVASLTRFVGLIPAVDVFYLPFLFNTEELVRAATERDSPVRGPIDEAILETGSRVLWWQAYGGAVMLSKDAPVKGPADIKGKKVRVFGKTLFRWIEAIGGVPMPVSGSEQHQAYQRDMVDVGMTGASSVVSRELWNVMDHVTVINNVAVEFVVLVNERFWQGLPEAHKRIIEAAAAKADLAVREEIGRIERDAYETAKANGMRVYRPTPEELEAWKASSQPVVRAYLKESGDLGKRVYDAAKSLKK